MRDIRCEKSWEPRRAWESLPINGSLPDYPLKPDPANSFEVVRDFVSSASLALRSIRHQRCWSRPDDPQRPVNLAIRPSSPKVHPAKGLAKLTA